MDRPNIFRHPLTRVGLLLVGFRFLGLAHRHLILGGGGIIERFGVFLATLIQHVGVLAIVIGGFLLFWKSIPPLRVVTTWCGGTFFFVLMIFGQIDLTLSGITGATFTPTTLRTYRGPQLFFSKEFVEPVQENWLPVGLAVLLFSGASVWIVRMLWKPGRHPDQTPIGWMPVFLIIAIATSVVATAPRVGLRAAADPVEIAFFKEYAGLDGVSLRVSESEAIQFMRDWVGLPPGARWVSERYPLIYASANGEERESRRPDIVVVMVESMRASELGFIRNLKDGVASITPRLDALAKESLVFPAYISNGFPSAPSVIAFQCSAIPHLKKEIMTDFTDRSFDSIPTRLKDFGYETVFIGANPSFDNQTQWFKQWFGDISDLHAEGIGISDKNIINRSISVIAEHDRVSPRKPLFAYVSTVSLHYPFKTPFDADPPQGESPGNTLHDNYRRTLRYCDQHIGRLIDFIKNRPRSDDTIIIVTGDHGFYVNLKETSGLPENDNQWVSAIINGSKSIIGPPRRDYRAASHVDMLPTVLGIIGDRRPVGALGSDLLKAPRKIGGWALAVRAGGFRVDAGSRRVIVDVRTPGQAAFGPSFPEMSNVAGFNAVTGTAEIRAQGVYDLVRTWAYLVENDRIWDPTLLKRVAQSE